MATRVRERRYLRQPVLTPHWTPGDHQPTALALAAPGLLSLIADKMGRHVNTLEKWAQGERGPEPDLRDLFLALAAVGLPREMAALIPARIEALFRSVYDQQLPTLAELHERETAAEGAENNSQIDCALHATDLDVQLRYLTDVLRERGVLDTLAAVLTRNLHAAGRL
jgi:transcriptional regulator with XRE-family HTH domain